MEDEMNLVETLTLNLQSVLDKQWQMGESPQVVMRGSFGEAIAASRERILLLHEKLASMGEESVAVFSYPFRNIEAIEVTSTQTGAQLQIRLHNLPEDPEDATLHLPSYDLSKFEVVATKLRVLLETDRDQNLTLPSSAPEVSLSTVRRPDPSCPDCGAVILPGSAHCVSCGHRVRAKCSVCHTALNLGWVHCPNCGTDTRLRAAEACPHCGHVLEFGGFIYCPYCGQRIAKLCSQCSGALQSHWQFCPNCGRQAGTLPSQGRAALWRETREQEAEEEEEHLPTHSEIKQAEAFNTRGIESYEAEKLGDAIVLFRKAISLDPDNATYHLNLAVAYGEKGMDEDALSEYDEVLHLDPGNISAYLNMGYLLNEREDTEGARRAWEKVLELDPASQEADEARTALEGMEGV